MKEYKAAGHSADGTDRTFVTKLKASLKTNQYQDECLPGVQ
jgi:hypothetical protein